jgi:hypothetical protein
VFKGKWRVGKGGDANGALHRLRPRGERDE